MRVSPHSTVTAALLMVMPFGLLERVEVGGGVAVIDVADLVLGAAEVEDALGGRGLARVHVGDDADVAQFSSMVLTSLPWQPGQETRLPTLLRSVANDGPFLLLERQSRGPRFMPGTGEGTAIRLFRGGYLFHRQLRELS